MAMDSSFKYLFKGVDEVGTSGAPRPLWKARLCAELMASSDTSPSSRCWARWMIGSISSWYSWAVQIALKELQIQCTSSTYRCILFARLLHQATL